MFFRVRKKIILRNFPKLNFFPRKSFASTRPFLVGPGYIYRECIGGQIRPGSNFPASGTAVLVTQRVRTDPALISVPLKDLPPDSLQNLIIVQQANRNLYSNTEEPSLPFIVVISWNFLFVYAGHFEYSYVHWTFRLHALIPCKIIF